MAVDLALLRHLQSAAPSQAWAAILDHAWRVCAADLTQASARRQVSSRDQQIGDLDLFLAAVGWDLWAEFSSVVPRAADALASWWATPGPAAILVLDALSLREVPWLLQGARERGYTVGAGRALAAEIPADTDAFASALGFGKRANLSNNAGQSPRFPGARTESAALPFGDAASMVGSEPRWIFWHHWPDHRVHDLSDQGSGGLPALVDEAARELCSTGFWSLVERLSQGRRVVVTSDHGYAATGAFTDATDADHVRYLRERFKAGRNTPGGGDDGPFVPPLDLKLLGVHGEGRYALGRRKWKVAGGYPTLAHGGLSVLEVCVPFIELRRPA